MVEYLHVSKPLQGQKPSQVPFEACLDLWGGIERVRCPVLEDAAILELADDRVDAFRLGMLQARKLLSLEGLDVRSEHGVLILPATARRALALGE